LGSWCKSRVCPTDRLCTSLADYSNTRNTCSSLRSFLEKDKRADFSDVIAGLDERKRQLVREVEAQQLLLIRSKVVCTAPPI
jgi:hypothetical protein